MTPQEKVEEAIENLRRHKRPYAIATVVRSLNLTSAKPGAKAVVSADGSLVGWIGGGCAQPAVRRAALEAIETSRPRFIRIRPSQESAVEEEMEDFTAHCHSGGTLDIFIEPVLPTPTVLILGSSPVGQALARLAPQAGLSVMVVVRPGDAKLYEGIEHMQEGFDVEPSNTHRFAVVATQGRSDREGLKAALGSGAGYVAFVASGKKAGKLKEELAASGVSSAALERIKAPAGLDIGAVTPEEIAVSILAEIVRERRSIMASLVEELSHGP